MAPEKVEKAEKVEKVEKEKSEKAEKPKVTTWQPKVRLGLGSEKADGFSTRQSTC